MKTCISLNMLRELSASGKTVCLPENSVLSPSAKDFAREKGLVIYIEGKNDPVVGVSTGTGAPQPAVQTAEHPAIQNAEQTAAQHTKQAAPAETINADILKEIIKKVILDQKKPICENPKAMKIEGDKVVMEPFSEAPAGQKIGMTDVITEREGNLGAGFMTFDHSELPWTLSYDEVDYVVEGEFTIKTGGRLYTMKPGDVFHIPKGTSVVFGSPSFCKVFYVVYPANWLSQNK
ncbi:MAG: ethanolamine utilization protein [Bacillota bacterium]|nr:ethanolamine utilization protein [Bacillota bacterium]